MNCIKPIPAFPKGRSADSQTQNLFQQNFVLHHQVFGVFLKSPLWGDLEGLFPYIAALKFRYG